MGQYSIKDVEVLSGVKAHTLRIWEQRYGFMKPNRTDTNIRYYTDEELRRILNVSLLNRNGFKISKIAVMSDAAVSKEVLHLEKEVHTPDNLLDTMVHAMLDFDEQKFEDTLNTALEKMDFQKVFSDLMFPFLVRTGVLWSVGTVRPAQEHFMSNLIRRKLIAGIDKLVVKPDENSKRFVLFLPEGETHELLLLFTEYMLRSNNHQVTYLGNSVPFEDIEYISNHLKPHFLVAYFTVPMQENDLQEYIQKLTHAFPNQQLLAGGMQMDIHDIKLGSNAHKVRSMEDFVKAIG